MAREVITMPQLGESVTEGTVTKWLKNIGDEITEDELLFEVSTDKVDSEVPSPAAGTLVEILVGEGDTVDVGTRLCVIDDAASAPAPTRTESQLVFDEPAAASAPPKPAPTPAPPTDAVPTGADKPKLLSPIVRRLISENGLDAAQINGTGAGGRITRNDVMAHIESDDRATATAPPTPEPTPKPAPIVARAPTTAPTTAPSSNRDETIPFSNIRRRTAEHMLMSKATSAHVMMSVEVDYENVERVRRAHRQTWKQSEGFSLTYLPFIARAVCDAIANFPNVNASVEGNSLVVHHYVNLAIAVDLGHTGLVVPVIRDAETKRMRHLAHEVRDLAERARAKRLTPDELAGGTFTITNPGPYGTFVGTPVINQPQVAIMSTEGIKKRPTVIDVDGTDAIAIHHIGNLAFVFDHRAFDGAYSAEFLNRVREIIETRDWEAELA